MFTGGMLDPFLPAGWHIPQAEEIPVLGTIVDVFAVLVLIGLIASSIRRYVFTPPGLQRTWDATMVVSLIAALMVTFLLSEAGTHIRESAAKAAGQALEGWGQTWLPAGALTAKILLGIGVAGATVMSIGLVCWWIHLFILLFFLVYLPYSKHMHLMWAPFAVFLGELPQKKGTLEAPACRGRGRDREGRNIRSSGPAIGSIHLAAVAQRLYLCRVRPLRTVVSRIGQRSQALAPADRPRPQGICS